MPSDERENLRELTPTDLRGILKYVPQWRNHVFVVALDGAVMEHGNFENLMLELAVLRNLSIKLVIIFGIGAQLQRLAAERAIAITDARGYGPTDASTLELAIEASGRVAHHLTQGLTRKGLKTAQVNAVRATERGVLQGVDQLHAGKVEKIDEEVLRHLIDREIVPLVSPIGFNRDGDALRLNSDLLASRIATALQASKLLFVLPYPGLTYNGEFRLNAPVDEVRAKLDEVPCPIDEEVRSKALFAVRTIDGGVPRAHLIDCRIHDGLLTEVFSKVGIGSMIHSNPYMRIRPATPHDVTAIFNITKSAVRDEALRARSLESIEAAIDHYFIYEIDESIIGCARLTPYPGADVLEIGSVFVQPAYQGRNIGKALVDFAIDEARRRKVAALIALSTQAAPFFKKACGFVEAELEDLPPALRDLLTTSQRNSRILRHPLQA
ncbi:MAG: amino-acid N-acetyltransferase [Verrucomicrobiota bacterium]